ncbi:MBL fold metallo-hydrolase [Corynebacterium gerontici]|uniref:MBL fold metallo-hydrolase n=1 Tax=Corynebacterium gerontici TaxID=2079234 RepID=UPI000F4EED27|nr:MBL fold metallo-hydrolase [Corynebacterium gerontici]
MELLGFAAGPYQTNCYVLIAGQRATVIDPGMNAQGPIEQYLSEHHIELEQVVLTHGHIDHTRDAASLANAWDVPVWIHRADAFMLEAGEGVSPESQVLFCAATMPQAKHLEFLKHGETITMAGEKFAIRHAPGHSPGSLLFVGATVCFSGDVLFQGSIGRTDLPQSDPEAMEVSLREQVATLSPNLQVLPGHGPSTTVRAELASNPFLQSKR